MQLRCIPTSLGDRRIETKKFAQLALAGVLIVWFPACGAGNIPAALAPDTILHNARW
jgi:hypothetical protein